ncbi:5-formyltetrahydrofolate cyclo-ligase [Rubripirellula obstinata]|nr:5-formyltetrahydrofolate cyclo-ligase [Rubripirellula obstinata]
MDESLADQKTALRKAARAARKAAKIEIASESQVLESQIANRLLALPEYQSAKCVMWYIDVRDEVPTRAAIQAGLDGGKIVVVPYCVDGELELFLLRSMRDVEPGEYGILEPKVSLRQIADRRPRVADIDLIVVPGVAFGIDGERLGHGKGYYDKLLSNAKPETMLVGLAMQCQIFDKLPMQDHDIYMDRVVTEENVYQGRGRRQSKRK